VFHSKTIRRSHFLLGALLVVPSVLPAQPATPHVGYVYPAGGRQGTTFQVTLGGQFLGGATNIYVSGAGVKAAVVEYSRPLNPKEFNELRDELRTLQAKRTGKPGQADGLARTNTTAAAWTTADQTRLMEIRRKLARSGPRNQLNPAIAETVVAQVTVAADAPANSREVRLEAAGGLSNPLRFQIGTLPEVSQKSAGNPENPPPGKPGKPRRPNQGGATPPREMNVALPAVLNGQIMPGGVDRFRFYGHEGQHLVVLAQARALIPYLPDAVPGWFQAALALFDAQGKELTHADHYQFHPDPVLSYLLPKDGSYVLEIRDSLYRGREDFVYRVEVGELPFVTSVFPLGAPVGAQTRVELLGWNLRMTNYLVDTRDREPGTHFIADAAATVTPFAFAVDSLPECREQESNDTLTTAQSIALPCVINGRIDAPGDRDVFRFDGKARTEVVAEVVARRLNSPIDSTLKLMDATGRQLAFNDDYEDKGAGLETHHADSRITCQLPANGAYYLELVDAQHQGGPAFAYRLRVSEPRPDFELRVVPASLTVRGGTASLLTVYALRKDGFTNAINVSLKDAPPGFALSGATVPANQDQVRMTLTAPAVTDGEPISLRLAGQARIQGRDVVRTAVPAEDMMQAFAYRHLVPVQDLAVSVSGRWPGRGALKILGPLPVKIPVGGTARVRIAGPRGLLSERVQLELSEPPDGISVQKIEPLPQGAEIILQSDGAKVKAGTTGNLIVAAYPNRPAAGKAKGPANQRRTPFGTLPAIPYQVVAE